MFKRLLGLGLLAIAVPAMAQDTAEAPPESAVVETIETIPVNPAPEESPPDDTTQLDDLVVTATKRSQSVREIPVTINALHGEDLEKIGARELKDFIDLVPGISLQEGSADKPRKLSIRGVGPSDGANQTTGILLGDVPLTDPYGTLLIADPDPFDLRTVEILKGPQGTLFGASSLNGAIRYVPNEPELATWQGKGLADWVTVREGGSEPTVGAALNAPIGDHAAVRVSGVMQRIPGVIDFAYRDRPAVEDGDSGSKWTGRAMGRWEATDRLSVNALYMHQLSEVDELSFVTNREGRLERDDAPRPSTLDVEFSVASLDLRYAFDWATLVSLTARQTKDSVLDLDASYAGAVASAAEGVSSVGGFKSSDALGYIQELRLVSPDGGPWSWLGGAIHSEYTADVFTDIFVIGTDVLGPIPGAGSDNGLSAANQSFRPLKARESAVFGELTRDFDSPWTLTLGGRLYQSQVGGTANTSGLLILASQQTAESEEYLEVRGKGFNPKIAATWQATGDVMVYGNVSRGFQFGGINLEVTRLPGGANEHPTFKSSTLWNYEIGVRSDWLDRTLRVDLTAFHLDWTNPQVQQIVQPTGLAAYVDNVGASRSDGLEATLRYLTPIPGVSLSAAGSYIVAKTTETFESSTGRTIPAGTDMPLSPKLQTATTLAYSNFFGPWATGAALVHSYQGEAFNNIEHHQRVYGFGVFNLNFNIARPDVRFRPVFTLSANNLTDTRELIGAAGGTPTNSNSVSRLASSYNRPRSISLRLTAEF